MSDTETAGPGDEAASAVDLAGFNPFDPVVQQCPHPYYRRMQAENPVFPVEGTDLYLVTRHASIVPILRNTQLFSSNFGSAGEQPRGEVVERIKAVLARGWPQVPTMLTVDPPQHHRFRGTVAPYFAPKQLAWLRQPIGAIVHRLVDRMLDATRTGEPIEIVASFAVPLPVEVIAMVLNVPNDRMADFKRWSDDLIANVGTVISDDRRVEAFEGIVEFQHYFAAELEQRRREPCGDLMSDLVHAEIDTDAGGKRPLAMSEALSILQQLLAAGNETTTKALTEGVLLLAQHPEQWDALRADPAGRAPLVTEEVLRLSSPTQGMFRLVTRDTEIDGVAVPGGSRVVLLYAGANRDPAVWGDDPDAFDPDRPNLKEHLAFGKGVHFCLGAPLSRLELQTAFEALATRCASIELAGTHPLEYHPSFMLRGLQRLDVRLAPA
jgi:cytochrome P450